ncbi:MAG: DUF6174 domain-containing protein [Pirellulales bacterium]
MSDDPERSNEPLPDGSPRRTPLVIAAVIAVVLPALLCAGILAWFRQDVPRLTDRSLELAIDRWREHGPESYTMEIELGGMRPGTVHLEVRDGEVTAMQRDGYTPERRVWETWSVPGMFDTIDRELQIAEAPAEEAQFPPGTQFELRAEFDARLGYPRRFRRMVLGEGTEVSWQVTRFRVE